MSDQRQDIPPALTKDFRNFLFYMWAYLGLPAPTAVQYDVAWYLQHGPTRRIIEAFRGVGKSWITAMYVIWRLLCNPNERILVVSASKDRADAFSIFVKRLIDEVPILQHLRPKPGQRDSNIAFDVGPSSPAQAPSLRSVGINGQLTGGRATIIVADDVEVPKNSLTQTMREKLAESVKEFDAILMSDEDIKTIGMERTEIIYLGTPQAEQSLYNALAPRGYSVRVWPARFPSQKQQDRLGDTLAPMLRKQLEQNPKLSEDCEGRGAPTDPARFTDADLVKRQMSYGRSGFAMQFMLDTSVSDQDRYPLKLSDLVVMALNREMAPVKIAWASGPDQVITDLPNVGMFGDRYHRPMFVHKDFKDYSGVMMAIDPAGRGGDELSYAVVAMLNGWLYLLESGGLRGGYKDENLELLARIAKRNKVKHIRVESNFGDGMFTKLLTPWLTRIYPCTTEDKHSSQQKEKRIIDTLEPVMNQHRLVVADEVIKLDAQVEDPKYQLMYQLTRITKDRGSLAKDDRIDVLAMAVAYWVEQMDGDAQSIEQDHIEALRQADLEKFMEGVLGRVPGGHQWADTGQGVGE